MRDAGKNTLELSPSRLDAINNQIFQVYFGPITSLSNTTKQTSGTAKPSLASRYYNDGRRMKNSIARRHSKPINKSGHLGRKSPSDKSDVRGELNVSPGNYRGGPNGPTPQPSRL